jgi:hypothetical protein
MTAVRFFSSLFAALSLIATPRALAQEDGLRVGQAKVDITPTIPVTLAGYASRTNLSQGVHDPLSARALAFEHRGKRLVLVSTDILGFYNETCEPLRAAILEACQLKPAELFLAAIHTHAAPNPALQRALGHANNVAYTQGLRTQLMNVVQAALANLAPGSVGTGAGASPVGANRRQTVTDSAGRSRVVLGRNPAAMTDREVQVVRVRRAPGDAVAAVLFAYATHSTSLGPGNYLISGDVHGLAEQFVETHLGNGVVAPGFAGASGDIDPWFRVRPEFKTTNSWIPEPVLLGTLLGEEVVNVSLAIREVSRVGPVSSILKTVDLPAKSREENRAASGAPTLPLTITVGRVGRVAVVGLGGEVFNDIGRTIKAASPFSPTLVITHCNGAAGYLPVKQAYAEGGYEVQTSRFADGAAEMVLKEVAALLKELKDIR